MDPELAAYDEAWRTSTERNAVCQAMADQYVAAHPELKAKYGNLTQSECVTRVDAARAAGDEEERIRLDIWINAAFEYQTITGYFGEERGLPTINAAGERRI